MLTIILNDTILDKTNADKIIKDLRTDIFKKLLCSDYSKNILVVKFFDKILLNCEFSSQMTGVTKIIDIIRESINEKTKLDNVIKNMEVSKNVNEG